MSDNNDYLDKLNSAQRAAVEYLGGPELVIAGAGSGKTRVLTYKIVHLLNMGHYPGRILALTFTNKAAREMRERIEALVGQAVASRLWMGTFHSIFSRFLRMHADRIGFSPNFTIYDSADSKSLVKTIIKELKLDDKIYRPGIVLNAISQAKNNLYSPEDYAADTELTNSDKSSGRGRTHEIYRLYRDRCRIAGAMDFDDLLFYTNVLLRENPDVRNHYRGFFRYVLVDEYQDTNFAQHCIVSELCRDSDALTMVGDDAQSIYSFRGANIKNILNLRNAYPNLRVFKLEQNYRSTQNIVNAANSLIAKNSEQIRKEVFSENEVGAKIEVLHCFSEYEEAAMVTSRIRQVRMRSKDSYDEFAVLYRTNAQSRRLEEALRKEGIKYRIYGGLSFYQRKEVKDAVAYFRLAVNPDDDEALRRVINYPARGIGDTTVGRVTRAAMEGGVSIWTALCDPAAYPSGCQAAALKKLAGFEEMIREFNVLHSQGASAFDLASRIYSRTRILANLISDTTPESISQQENLEELLQSVREFVDDAAEEGREGETSMSHFLAQASLATDMDREEEGDDPAVTLMTAHAAKGLEFNNVFVVGVEEDLFPSAMSQGSLSEIEEERRLLYVAVTRARRFCMMTYAGSRFRNGQPVSCQMSRFIRDIDPKYLKLMQGTAIDDTPRRGADPYASYRASYHSPAATLGIIDPAPKRPGQRSVWQRREDVAKIPAPAVSASVSASGCSVHSVSEVAAGMAIAHERFGAGKIVEVLDDPAGPKIVVRFAGAEQRTLMLKYARFKIEPTQ